MRGAEGSKKMAMATLTTPEMGVPLEAIRPARQTDREPTEIITYGHGQESSDDVQRVEEGVARGAEGQHEDGHDYVDLARNGSPTGANEVRHGHGEESLDDVQRVEEGVEGGVAGQHPPQS